MLVMEQDENPRLNEMDKQMSQMTQRMIALREENDELRASNGDVHRKTYADSSTQLDDTRIPQFRSNAEKNRTKINELQ